MSELSQQLTDDLKTAMREKNTLALNVIRMLKSALKNAAIAKGSADAELTGEEAEAVVRKEVKKRQDSVEQYEKGGRPELAAQEAAEIEFLNQYLPAPLSEEELNRLLEDALAETGATSRKEMGQVIKLLQEKTAGRADGRTLSQLVAARLS